jgi:SAM-dependent methyltransferase
LLHSENAHHGAHTSLTRMTDRTPTPTPEQEPERVLHPSLLRRLLWRARRLVAADYVNFGGCRLPPAHMRDAMCGVEYALADKFLESGRAEARRLIAKLAYTADSNVVEIGCGLGRLAIGLMRECGNVRYWGFDAKRPWIAWCKTHIERRHPSFRFFHVDVANDLYNPNGKVILEEFRFPLADGHADIVYLWGVFTNMRLSDVRIYVSEIGRLLRPGGRVFLTAFVEKNVAPESVNPTGYVNFECHLPLQVVRYDQDVLFSIFAEHGLEVEEFAHHGGAHFNQSEIYLRKTGPERTAVGIAGAGA